MDFNNEAREELLLALQTLEQSYNSLDIKYKNALKVQANYELLLSERVKELQCHSRLTEILGHSDYSLNESLSKIVKILPEAWQYPEIAEAMIKVGETNFATENYEISKWKQQIDILSHGEKTGIVSLGYLDDSRIDPNEPFLNEEYELLFSISGRLSDYIDKDRAKNSLEKSEIRYKTFFDDNHSVTLLINPETGEITDANPAACRYYGWSHSEMCSMNISNINTLSMDELMVEMQRSINEDRNHFIFRHRIANGAIRDVEVYSGPIQFGNTTMLYSIVHDITERLQAEAKIIKGSRLYAVISQINQAIVKCKDKSILLNEVCRISIEFGQFKMVWVGIVNLETNVVTPIITKGYEEGYLLNIKQISLSEDFEGSGPTGTALREGRYFVCNDIANDPHMILWKNEALQRGYHSSITLPLKQFGKVFAAFNLYSSTAHFFNDDEIKLLSEMAENISYALEAIDIERERLFVEEEKMKLSRAVEQSPVTIVITNIEGNIEYANTRACETTGYTLEELYGLNPRVLKSGETSPEEYDVLWKTISEGNSWYGIFHNKRKTGELYWESTTISPITDINGNITNYLAIKEDITERKKSEQEIRELNENLELKITQRTEQLAETNISLVKEIEDRKKAEDEIMKARLESERANMAKSEFLSRMSHELRTPMNSILGFAQLLEMGDLNPGQKKGVNHIKRSGKHLLDLINEVLDISRIEAGHLSLSFEPVQIFGVIHEMVELVSEQAKKRQINIEFIESENNYLSLRSDKRRLKQIILNLLNNAIKYNKAGGTATIEVELISQNKPNVTQIRISIKDTGQGIATENLHKLFNPFERIGAEKTDTEGTGLGLSVVKKLVDAMEGQIGVESEPGVGSTFWVEFPLNEDI
jgi:PAS domain S-box-containing protein